MCVFDSNPEVDASAPKSYRIRRAMTVQEFIEQIASDIKQDPKRLRLWHMVNRQNKTIRPDLPIMDTKPTVEEIFSRATGTRDNALRVWVELAEEIDESGEPVWPSYQSQLNSASSKSDTILLLLKHFDTEAQTLRGVGHVYVGKEKKVEDLVPLILRKMGWSDKLSPDEKLLLWEVSESCEVQASSARGLPLTRKSNRP